MKIHIAADHAGVDLKKAIFSHLTKRGLDVIDHGPFSTDSVDYPDFAALVCKSIPPENADVFGILVCGSGQGMAIAANKYAHIRAALCFQSEIAKLSREHNNANVLCLGSRFLTDAEALIIADVFLNTSFAGGRHLTRVSKIHSLPR